MRACASPGARLSSIARATEAEVRAGRISLLFVSPERLAQNDLPRLLAQVPVPAVAIDEAHCISHWGHDFRPEYRMMSRIREFFPKVSVHGWLYDMEKGEILAYDPETGDWKGLLEV